MRLSFVFVFVSRCHFVSFGDGRKGYGSAMKRLKKEVLRLDPNAQVWLFDKSKIDDEIEDTIEIILTTADDELQLEPEFIEV